MKKIKKIIIALLTAILLITTFSACSKKVESTPVKIDDFRTTAYIVGNNLRDIDNLDTSHFDQITDFIFFGCAKFDEDGNVILDEDFDEVYGNLKNALNGKEGKKVYLNILGPDAQTNSEDWNEQMKDKGDRHNKAFQSGNLENNIKSVLDKYGFDGIFFDYEFTIKNKNWDIYSDFILSLDKALGDKYEIGMALAGWDIKLSKEAKQVVDRIEVMSYDLWEKDGTHASYEIAQEDIKKFEKAGFDKAKLDLGVPFYARPTTQDAVWYDYKEYIDKIDENGFGKDEERNLTVSFNTYDVIAKKTELAIDSGCGGMMIWHYACDVPQSNEKSLFNAIENTVNEKANQQDK